MYDEEQMPKPNIIHTGYYGCLDAFRAIYTAWNANIHDSYDAFNGVYLSHTNEVIIISPTAVELSLKHLIEFGTRYILNNSSARILDTYRNFINVFRRKPALDELEEGGFMVSKTYTVDDSIVRMSIVNDSASCYNRTPAKELNVKVSSLAYLYLVAVDAETFDFMPKELDGEEFDPIKSESIRYVIKDMPKARTQKFNDLDVEQGKLKNELEERYMQALNDELNKLKADFQSKRAQLNNQYEEEYKSLKESIGISDLSVYRVD